MQQQSEWQLLAEQEGEYELSVLINSEGTPTHAKFWVNDDGSPQSNDERYYGEAWAQNYLRSWDPVPRRVLVIDNSAVEQDESGAIIAPIQVRWRTQIEVLIDCQQPPDGETILFGMSNWLTYGLDWEGNVPLSIFSTVVQPGSRPYYQIKRDPNKRSLDKQKGTSILPPYKTPLLLEDIEPLMQFVEDALVDAKQDARTSDRLEALQILHEVYQVIAKAQEVTLEQVCRQRCKDDFRIAPDDFDALNQED